MIVGTGKTIYVNDPYGAFQSAPEADLSKWSTVALPSVVTDAGSNTFSLAYDPAHHVMYVGAIGTSANFSGGLWRMVLE